MDATSREPAGRLITGILDDAGQLIRKEIALAKEETRGEIKEMKSHVVGLAVGGVTLLFGVLLLLMAAAHGLATALEVPLYAGYAMVGLVAAMGGGTVIASAGRGVKDDVREVARQGGLFKRELAQDVAALRPAGSGRS